ncbi:MAG: hypothetical protein KZQ99_18770 [Candidatus Thiodiazotropha sp. (ex Dulcina madagascariensis)]|nr:hypothetical protein [Candidatus Thiodiazotropha sp. (ex Dulcina madagascariensis)]
MSDRNPDIHPSFASYLKEKDPVAYIRALCEQGLGWWFEMRFPEIACHLGPVMDLQDPASLPSRLLFLTAAIDPATQEATYDELFNRFSTENDHEGAAAACCAGAAAVWGSGSALERLSPWERRIEACLAWDNRVSDLARASLLCLKGQIQHARYGEIKEALKRYRESMALAERSESRSLMAFSAGLLIYPVTLMGRRSELDALLLSAMPLCDQPQVSPFCDAYLQMSVGLALSLKGETAQGEQRLKQLAAQPHFPHLPPSLQLFTLGHLLMTLAFQHKNDEAHALAERMLNLGIPDGHAFFNAYAHNCLAEAALLAGAPSKALAHARESIDRGRASGSPIPELMVNLIIAQAQIDLGELEQAQALLTTWIDPWLEKGFRFHASIAHLELAGIQVKKGMVEKARQHYEQALAIIPQQERLPHLHRPSAFTQALERQIHPANGESHCWTGVAEAPIKVLTFGELLLQINDREIYDRDWYGSSTKALLKTLIALGGKKISYEVLCDLLWPDADGDAAARNLKVAIHRLKKTGNDSPDPVVPWLLVKHKSVSLSGVLCHVDSLYFEAELSHVLGNGADIAGLAALLDLYRGDFLANDASEAWIVSRREALRKQYIHGVTSLHDVCLKEGQEPLAVPYLEKGLEYAPFQEALYERLMAVHLGMGYPSKALLIYRRAEEALRDGLDVRTGDALQSLAAQAKGSY